MAEKSEHRVVRIRTASVALKEAADVKAKIAALEKQVYENPFNNVLNEEVNKATAQLWEKHNGLVAEAVRLEAGLPAPPAPPRPRPPAKPAPRTVAKNARYTSKYTAKDVAELIVAALADSDDEVADQKMFSVGWDQMRGVRDAIEHSMSEIRVTNYDQAIHSANNHMFARIFAELLLADASAKIARREINERLDALEARPAAKGVVYRGVFEAGETYEPGDMCTYSGSAWHCGEPTTEKPGDGKAWVLAVKRGRDGKSADALPQIRDLEARIAQLEQQRGTPNVRYS